MPTFAGDTIRKFSANCSEMKQLAARDFEDLLQVKTVNATVEVLCLLVELFSVQFQFLKAFCQNLTINEF